MMLTTRGVLLLLLAAPFIAAATWFPALQWAALIYILLVAALLVADWRAAGTVEQFEVERVHDSKLSLGADNLIRLIVRNRSNRPLALQMRDEPPPAFQLNHPAEDQIFRQEVAVRDTWEASYYVRPLRRGDYAFGDINLRWPGPMQLVVRQGAIPAAVGVKVYPNLLDVRRYDLMMRQNRLQEIGLRHTRLPGQGTEFERLREYRPDDEYRRIDWKATARRLRPITIEYQIERSQNIVAVLDTGRMMQSPVEEIAKLDYAVNAVLLLAYVATGMGDKVGMLSFDADVSNYLPPRQGRGQFYRMLERLYAVEAQPVEPDYGRALSYLALKQRRRALTIIFTDLSGGMTMQSLVEHTSTMARHSLPLVVTISDPDVHELAAARPQDTTAVYRRAAAMQLLEERRATLDHLRRHGVLTLDVPANQLSLSVVNRYLELKRRMRL